MYNDIYPHYDDLHNSFFDLKILYVLLTFYLYDLKILHILPPHSLLATADSLSVSIVLPFPECYIIGIT